MRLGIPVPHSNTAREEAGGGAWKLLFHLQSDCEHQIVPPLYWDPAKRRDLEPRSTGDARLNVAALHLVHQVIA